MRRDFQPLFAGARPLSLKDLDALFARTLSPADARRHYAEMLGLVEYLVAARGEGAVACLVRGLAGGASVETVLLSETGLNGESLVTAWKSWAGL
jgi:hypothetical protein